MEKNLEYYLGLNYSFNVKPDLDDGGYVAEFPDLRYCGGRCYDCKRRMDQGYI